MSSFLRACPGLRDKGNKTDAFGFVRILTTER